MVGVTRWVVVVRLVVVVGRVVVVVLRVVVVVGWNRKISSTNSWKSNQVSTHPGCGSSWSWCCPGRRRWWEIFLRWRCTTSRGGNGSRCWDPLWQCKGLIRFRVVVTASAIRIRVGTARFGIVVSTGSVGILLSQRTSRCCWRSCSSGCTLSMYQNVLQNYLVNYVINHSLPLLWL